MEPIDKAQDNRDRAAEALRLSRLKERLPLERELDLRLAKTYKNLAESREFLRQSEADAEERGKDAAIPLEKLNASNDR